MRKFITFANSDFGFGVLSFVAAGVFMPFIFPYGATIALGCLPVGVWGVFRSPYSVVVKLLTVVGCFGLLLTSYWLIFVFPFQ